MALVFPEPPLTAGGIVLRQLDEADAPWIAAACAGPEMSHFVPLIPSPYTEADAVAFVHRAGRCWKDGTNAPFVIADLDGQGLGVIELHFARDDPGLAGVGYWLRPEARGKGAATGALKLVANWALHTLGVERLHLVTVPENIPSQAVAQRAGFTREGLLRQWMPTTQGRRDCIMFSLLAADRDRPLA